MTNDSPENVYAATVGINKGTATFSDNVLTLAGGTTIALGVAILVTPITSRLFGPEAFGLAALFNSGATMLGVIACLRYEMAIVLPKKDKDSAQLFALCCIALVAMVSLTAVLTVVFGTRALVYLDAVVLQPYLWLFPLYVFLEGLQLPLNYWYTRHKRFKTRSAGRIVSSFSASIAEIAGGLAGFRAGGNLVVIRIFYLFSFPAYLLWRLSKVEARYIARNISHSGILKVAKRYRKFPLLDALSMLLGQLAWYAPIILLSAFFSPTVCGFYAKALYFLYIPSLIVGQSVGQVFLQESAASMAEGNNIAGLVEAVLNRMIAIGLFPFALLLIIGPEIFGVFLGARWTEAGVYVQILTPHLFMVFVLESIMNLFGTLGKQELNLLTSALYLILRVGIIVGGGLLLSDVRLTLFIFMVFNVLFDLWHTLLLLRAAKLSARWPLYHFIRCAVYVLPSVIPIAALKWWLGLEAIYLIALTPIFLIPYIVLVLRYDRELYNLFWKYLQRVRAFV